MSAKTPQFAGLLQDIELFYDLVLTATCRPVYVRPGFGFGWGRAFNWAGGRYAGMGPAAAGGVSGAVLCLGVGGLAGDWFGGEVLAGWSPLVGVWGVVGTSCRSAWRIAWTCHAQACPS
jgi:hypothetical protein